MNWNWWLKHYDSILAWLYIIVAVGFALMLTSCATMTPSDYRLDTTPDHDGEHYIGVAAS